MLLSCNRNTMPENPQEVMVNIKMTFDTEWTEWNHHIEENSLTDNGYGQTYDGSLESGSIRYVIRATDAEDPQGTFREFSYDKDTAEGYGHDAEIKLPEGEYEIMVWSDLVKKAGDQPFYDCRDFTEITLYGRHTGSCGHRDAFGAIVRTEIKDGDNTVNINMQRPLAKFEFITTDLQEFAAKSRNAEDYKVVFHYAGFMPDAYNLMTDKPVDSATGVSFESTPVMLNENEASLGYDLVLVNGKDAGVSVQIGIYDNEGNLLSVSAPIDVPLKRNHHTIIRGAFMTQTSQENITINPDFDGSHEYIID